MSPVIVRMTPPAGTAIFAPPLGACAGSAADSWSSHPSRAATPTAALPASRRKACRLLRSNFVASLPRIVMTTPDLAPDLRTFRTLAPDFRTGPPDLPHPGTGPSHRTSGPSAPSHQTVAPRTVAPSHRT